MTAERSGTQVCAPLLIHIFEKKCNRVAVGGAYGILLRYWRRNTRWCWTLGFD